jgi:hypothetical protein
MPLINLLKYISLPHLSMPFISLLKYISLPHLSMPLMSYIVGIDIYLVIVSVIIVNLID